MTDVYPKVLQSSYVVKLDSPSPVMVDMINSCEALVYYKEINADSISWRTSPMLAFWPRCGNDCTFLMTSGKSGATFMHVDKKRKRERKVA
jgi:hypothetical protein